MRITKYTTCNLNYRISITLVTRHNLLFVAHYQKKNTETPVKILQIKFYTETSEPSLEALAIANTVSTASS